MDFAASLFLISTELFANSCAPYACIGPNARPIDEPEEQALKKIAQALQLSLDAYL